MTDLIDDCVEMTDSLKRNFSNENGLTMKEQRIAFAAMDYLIEGLQAAGMLIDA